MTLRMRVCVCAGVYDITYEGMCVCRMCRMCMTLRMRVCVCVGCV